MAAAITGGLILMSDSRHTSRYLEALQTAGSVGRDPDNLRWGLCLSTTHHGTEGEANHSILGYRVQRDPSGNENHLLQPSITG